MNKFELMTSLRFSKEFSDKTERTGKDGKVLSKDGERCLESTRETFLACSLDKVQAIKVIEVNAKLSKAEKFTNYLQI